MFRFLNKNKTPADRIRSADQSTQKLRNQRAKLDPYTDEKKINRINNKIHKNNLEIKIANMELSQPKTEIKKTTNNTNINFNKNDNGKNFHVHYHSSKKK